MKKKQLLGVLMVAGTVARGQLSNARGTVVMGDGSALPKPVLVERWCGSSRVVPEAMTDRSGAYVLKTSAFEAASDWNSRQMGTFGTMKCYLRAVLAGYQSSMVDLDTLPLGGTAVQLPVITLQKKGSGGGMEVGVTAPKAARKSWEAGTKAMQAGKTEEAAAQFGLTAKAAPQWAPAWSALGAAQAKQGRKEEARASFAKAAEVDPKDPSAVLMQMRLEAQERRWAEAAERAGEAMRRDARKRHPEAQLTLALAKLHLGEVEEARRRAEEAAKLDVGHGLVNVPYVQGLVAEQRRDLAAAERFYKEYLKLEPKGEAAEQVRARLQRLGQADAFEIPDVALDARAAKSVWVPGGLRALGRAARVEGEPETAGFFAAYAKAVARYTEPSVGAGVPGYLESLRAYFETVKELTALAEGGERVSLSAKDAGERARTGRVLALMGWRLVGEGEAVRVKRSDGNSDLFRQRVGPALGLDEVELQEKLERGEEWVLPLTREEAPLMGGEAWLDLVKEKQALNGGLAEVFVKEPRLAKVYAALSGAGEEAAEALVAGVGLGRLAEQYGQLIGRYGAALQVAEGRVRVPGAEAAWAALVGAKPGEPVAFLRGLLEKGQGRMAAFYYEIARCDGEHQRWATASAERLQALYDGFKPAGLGELEPGWKSVYNELPLAGGELAAPGGLAVWPDWAHQVPAMVALVRLERARGARLDAGSAALLKKHGAGWKGLYPLFERRPELAAADFEALERFEANAQGLAAGARNARVGLWAALVELGAPWRQTTEELAGSGAGERAAARWKALGGLEGVRAKLPAERRAGFERVLRAQEGVDPGTLSGRDEAAFEQALTVVVYAARLAADALVLAEDPGFARRHEYVAKDGPVFRATELERHNQAPGSRVTGLLAGLESLKLAGGASSAVAPAAAVGGRVSKVSGGGLAAVDGATFRSDVRLVEVPATVFDGRARYADGLKAGDFEVYEEGQKLEMASFESRLGALSCALLLDSTLSMRAAMPMLKNSAEELITKLRPSDQVAVYTFSDHVEVAQGFTGETGAARRAVARAEARGETALYDAVLRVLHDLAGRQGKKVMVLFTDGDDNVSVLGAEAVIRRSRAAGVPVYTVAQGQALDNRRLLHELSAIAAATGGMDFAIREAKEIEGVFSAIAKDLEHGYLLTVRPGAAEAGKWRKLEVKVKGHQVRAREGYYTE